MFGIFATKYRRASEAKADSSNVIRKKWLGYLLFVPIAAALVYLSKDFRLDIFFPIKQVRVVDSANHVDPKVVKTTVLPDVESGFFRLNIKDLQMRLEQLPWVAGVAVMREWPDKVIINIDEYKPIARWNKQALVTLDGTVFSLQGTNKMPAHLPLLSGPDTQAQEIVSRFVAMDRMLAPLHRHIEALEVSDRLAWRIMLDNALLVNLGEASPLQRLNVFIGAYPQLIAESERQPDYIDMRYDHGMAVHWKN
ncbi:MAG: FtsQ-type POTRA domain-containing protein [Legionellales bacterium]|nr:FtsQ-type POTRA domain-containing protein [Legionellales bacterium]